jgi:hypothetical protein
LSGSREMAGMLRGCGETIKVSPFSAAWSRPGARTKARAGNGNCKTRREKKGSVGSVVDGDEFDEEVFDKFQRNLVRAVGKGVGGVRMDFHEQAVDAGGDGGAGEDRSQDAITAGGAAEAAGALDGVGGVENDRQAFLAHPVERAHVDDEVVVAEAGAAFAHGEIVGLDAGAGGGGAR